jgi:hypothetical protein
MLLHRGIPLKVDAFLPLDDQRLPLFLFDRIDLEQGRAKAGGTGWRVGRQDFATAFFFA